MLVGTQSFSPGGPNGIIRSQSFAGFSGLQERRSRQVRGAPRDAAEEELSFGAVQSTCVHRPPHHPPPPLATTKLFSSLWDWCNSFIENASALKKPQAKLKKMHNLGHKNTAPPRSRSPPGWRRCTGP
ncbi:hypothetical protein QTO34_010998 [Cnephaeus nilssonii]|uniref:Uncharacterized protein n=1 Tax=Cnephaeus nilssonii TaxID=3371016 RepID=A0AA40LEA6_CNENI|nr:hypothetical protein QTO34_010998 [Eptesicus nilssonii]